jgi:hypothetical protein
VGQEFGIACGFHRALCSYRNPESTEKNVFIPASGFRDTMGDRFARRGALRPWGLPIGQARRGLLYNGAPVTNRSYAP